MIFRWNDWNLAHAARHGVTPEEAELVVSHSRAPFPRRIDDDKFLVWGQAPGGRYLQVIFVKDLDLTTYIIHARRLDNAEKKRLRRMQS